MCHEDPSNVPQTFKSNHAHTQRTQSEQNQWKSNQSLLHVPEQRGLDMRYGTRTHLQGCSAQDDTCNDTITTYVTYTVLVAVWVVKVSSFVAFADLAVAIWTGVVFLSKKTHISLHSLLHGVAWECTRRWAQQNSGSSSASYFIASNQGVLQGNSPTVEKVDVPWRSIQRVADIQIESCAYTTNTERTKSVEK